jgi:hypothetical protein
MEQSALDKNDNTLKIIITVVVGLVACCLLVIVILALLGPYVSNFFGFKNVGLLLSAVA